MDPVDLVSLTRQLVDVDSTTGRETEAARVLAGYLRGRGWTVTEQPVDATRFNVLATRAAVPIVAFSTHMDCVPPFFPSRVEGDLIYGRGSGDAKGILVAQVAAAERLHDAGEDRVALLFVVGEERGSDGARKANLLGSTKYLVNGEPTGNRLALATRGTLRLRLVASGRAAHSSFPELGESAIEKLIEALTRLRALPLPEDALLGRTHYTVGLIAGGIAPNVIPPHAEAEVMFRTVGPPAELRDLVAPLRDLVHIDEVLDVPPVRMVNVAGLPTAVFPFTTDIPFLDRWGQPLLYGPSSIHVAHTDQEHVRIGELEEAVEGYVRIATELLARHA